MASRGRWEDFSASIVLVIPLGGYYTPERFDDKAPPCASDDSEQHCDEKRRDAAKERHENVSEQLVSCDARDRRQLGTGSALGGVLTLRAHAVRKKRPSRRLIFRRCQGAINFACAPRATWSSQENSSGSVFSSQ